MTEQDLHIIEMYLHGQLEGDEKSTFESRLKSDPEFSAQVAQMRVTIIALRESVLDEKRELLQLVENQETQSETKVFRMRPVYKWVALAAVLIAAVILIRPLLRPNESIKNPYLAEHFEDYVLHDTQKGNGDGTVDLEKMRAYNLYADQDFKHAIPLLQKYWETERDTLSLFYLWVSAIGSGKTSIEHQYEKIVKEDLSGNSKYEKILDELTEH